MLGRLSFIDVYAKDFDHINICEKIYIDTHTTKVFPMM